MEKKDIYIKDLTEENNRLFAMNDSIKQRRKDMKKELLHICDGYGSEEDIKKSAQLIGRLLGLAYLYRLNLKYIKTNLEVIRGLRNGTKQEI